MKRIKLNSKILILSLALAFPVALLSSAYTEEIQMSFWKSVKNLFIYGESKRGESESGIVYTIYNGERHINPVHMTMQVLLQAESVLSKHLDVEVIPYGTPKRNAASITEVADFLIDHYETEVIGDHHVVRFDYHFDYPIYDLKAPWYSGMAQGHATVVLLAAYVLTNDQAYLDFAKKAVALFRVPTTAGGVMVPLDDGSVWFEEYADPSKELSETPKVLNGHNYAVDGLFFYWLLTKDTKYKNLLEKSILGVEKNIHKYDTGYWSYYGLRGNYAHIGYHKLHVKQLSRLVTYDQILDSDRSEELIRHKLKFEKYVQVAPLGYLQRMAFQRNNLIYIIFFSNLILWCLVWCFILNVRLPTRQGWAK